MILSAQRCPSSVHVRRIIIAVCLFNACLQGAEEDALSPLPDDRPKPPEPIDELPQLEGSLVFSGEEIAEFYIKFEEERKTRQTDQREREDDSELELFTLKAFEVRSIDPDLYERLELALNNGLSDASPIESRLENNIRLEKLYTERADLRFWSGEYDATYKSDMPKLGSIDLGKLFGGMTSLLGKKKDKKLDQSKR